MLEHELHAVAQSGWVILVRDGDCFVEVDRLEAFLLSEIVVHFPQVWLGAKLAFDQLYQLGVIAANLLCFCSTRSLKSKPCLVLVLSLVLLDLVHLRLRCSFYQVLCSRARPTTPHGTGAHMWLSGAANGRFDNTCLASPYSIEVPKQSLSESLLPICGFILHDMSWRILLSIVKFSS